MTRLVIAALCAIWVVAVDVPAQAAPETQAQLQEDLQASVPGGNPPASAVKETASQPAAQDGAAAQGGTATQTGGTLEPKSAIPISERRGGDITKCLGNGNRTDQEIAACAEPYSPLHHHTMPRPKHHSKLRPKHQSKPQPQLHSQPDKKKK